MYLTSVTLVTSSVTVQIGAGSPANISLAGSSIPPFPALAPA